MSTKPTLIIFASGTKTGGGSGCESVVRASQGGELDAEIVAIVSNHEQGGVRERADRLGVPFIYFPGPFDAENYQRIVANSGAEWVMLSGWLKFVHGLDPARTFNIHPALLSFDHGRFGGPGMYWDRVHDAVYKAFQEGEIRETGPSMHFVTDEYDRGPVFFEYPMAIPNGASRDDVKQMTINAERAWQPKITNMVVHGEIRWDGKDPKSLVVPRGVPFSCQEVRRVKNMLA